MNLRAFFTAAICLLTYQSFAQEKSKVKFGKISVEELSQSVYPIDSNANAIIIADIGSTEMYGNNKGGVTLEFKRFMRAKILNKNGFDIATVEIPIYTDGTAEEELTSLKAVTYNLENGKIEETELNVKSDVYKEKISKHLTIKKFTLQNIKVGSVIEFQYKISSDFIFNLQPWDFQGKYPCLWSEYEVGIPQFYRFVVLKQGYQPYYINKSLERYSTFTINDHAGLYNSGRPNSFSALVYDYHWAMKDIPALKIEKFTSNLENHISRIRFQLSEVSDPFTQQRVLGSWLEATEKLLHDSDFGLSLTKDNWWLTDIVHDITKESKTPIDKAIAIYTYIRDNLTCTDHSALMISKPLKSVLSGKNGNIAEINLLLTAMLLKADLAASPVILSTRSHGYIFERYPLLDRFNYVISRLEIDGNFFYLDAGNPKLGFGRLLPDLYNGPAVVVNELATPVSFIADLLTESKLTFVIIINNAEQNLAGHVKQTPGYYQSYELRKKVKDAGTKELFSDLQKNFPAEIEITNPKIDSLENYDQPVTINYDFTFKNLKDDIIYFNPMLNEAWKDNPFKSAERSYPVELPYAVDETYLLNLEVPAGYTVDELPKPIQLKLNEAGDGYFEYKIKESGGSISLRTKLIIKRAFYLPDEYEILRAFYDMIVKKQQEQIVFKKIK